MVALCLSDGPPGPPKDPNLSLFTLFSLGSVGSDGLSPNCSKTFPPGTDVYRFGFFIFGLSCFYGVSCSLIMVEAEGF